MTTRVTAAAPAAAFSAPLKPTDVKTRLADAVVKAMQEIAKDNEARSKSFKENPSVLNGGIYYPDEFYDALVATKQEARITQLRDTGRDHFCRGFAPSECFEYHLPPGLDDVMYKPYLYVVKRGILPSDALDRLRRGVTLLCCMTTMWVVEHCALLTLFGKDRFNALFAADSSTPLTPNSDMYLTRLHIWGNLEKETSAEMLSNADKGEWIHVHGLKENPEDPDAPFYQGKHVGPVQGNGTGFNVVRTNEKEGKEASAQKPLWLGFGLREGVTHEGIVDILLEAHNKPVRTDSWWSAKLIREYKEGIKKFGYPSGEKFKDNVLTRKEFIRLGGGEVSRGAHFWHYRRIAELVNATTHNEARRLFDSWADGPTKTTPLAQAEAKAAIAVRRAPEDVLKQLVIVSQKAILDLAKHAQARLKGAENDSKLLHSGVYLPCDYYGVLVQKGQQQRITDLRDKMISGKPANRFFFGYVNAKHFHLVVPKAPKTPYSYMIKEGAKPSEALKTLMTEGLTFLNDTQAQVYAQFVALLEVFGEEKFNALFGADSPAKLTLSHSIQQRPFDKLMEKKTFDVNKKDVKVGQWVYFRDVQRDPKSYDFQHRGGVHALCVQQDLFGAFGLDPRGVSSDGVARSLCFRSPIDLQMFPADFQKEYAVSPSQPLTYDRFIQQGGGQLDDNYYTWNAARITELANASIEDARKMIASWYPKKTT